MTSLTEFLLARIAEDEAAARDCELPSKMLRGGLTVDRDERAFAECEAKRRIVERHASSGADGCYICCEYARDAVECVEQRLLALPYADHPDYDEAWRP